MRNGLACGKCARSLFEGRLRHSPAGVSEVAQRARRFSRPRLVGDLDPQRRHAGQARDPVPGAQAYHVAGQQIVHQHHMRADAEGGGQLAEPGVETQGQRGQDDVVGSVLQVLAHALRADDQVAMAKHHALGLARAAGRVEDRGDVKVDGAAQRRSCLVEVKHLGPPVDSGTPRPRRVDVCRPGIHQHDVRQIRAGIQSFAEQVQPFRRGDQHTRVAVAQDVCDLVWSQKWIDRHEGAAGCRGAKDRRDGLDAFVEEDRDALLALKAESD